MTSAIRGLLWAKICLLALSKVVGEAMMSHNVAEHLKALADELAALSDVRIKHVEVTHILVADVAWPRTAVAWSLSRA